MNFKTFTFLIGIVLAVFAVSPAISDKVCPDNPERCTELCQNRGKPEGFCGGFMENLCYCRDW